MEVNFDIDNISYELGRYDLGDLIETPIVIQGDIDVNYRLTTAKGRYILKHILNIKNLPQFEILGDLHEYLISKGIPVPQILKTNNGNYVENNFILYDFIDGEQKKNWTGDEIISLTSNFAHMLVAMKKYNVPDFIKNKTDKYTQASDINYCHNISRPIIIELPLDSFIKESIIKIIDILYKKLPGMISLPKYFVHGDLNEMNTLFKDGKNVGIIDIGGAYEPIIYDLGEFCYWFTMPYWSEDFNNERYKLIIETFNKILPLSALEMDLLPYMMLRRGMMDIMLTLDFDSKNHSQLSQKRLTLLTIRNNRIIDLLSGV